MLVTIQNGVDICLMLTEMNSDYPDEVYGLIDVADGKPVMKTIDLTLIEKVTRALCRVMTFDPYFDPSYPISVYHAAVQACEITTNDAALARAAQRLGMKP